MIEASSKNITYHGVKMTQGEYDKLYGNEKIFLSTTASNLPEGIANIPRILGTASIKLITDTPMPTDDPITYTNKIIKTGAAIVKATNDFGENYNKLSKLSNSEASKVSGEYVGKTLPSVVAMGVILHKVATVATPASTEAAVIEGGLDDVSTAASTAKKHINRNVKDIDAYDDIQKHLGDGIETNVHPGRGTIEPDSIYVKQPDGTYKGVRIGNHEVKNPNNQHYHLESFDADGNFIGPDQSVKINTTRKK